MLKFKKYEKTIYFYPPHWAYALYDIPCIEL